MADQLQSNIDLHALLMATAKAATNAVQKNVTPADYELSADIPSQPSNPASSGK